MQFRTLARRACAPEIALLATLVALTTLSPASASAGGHTARAGGTQRTTAVVQRFAGYGRSHGSRLVRRIQRQLDHLGYGADPVDGFFGPRTQAAVATFQRNQGLAPDGVVGPLTSARLRRLTAQGDLLRRGSGYDRPNGSDRVRRIQRRLDRLGLHAGPLDGLYGPRTESAVRRFQRAHGLAPDGVVGPRTHAALRRARGRLQQHAAHGPKPKPERGQTPPRHARPLTPGTGHAAFPISVVLIAFVALELLVFFGSYAWGRHRARPVQRAPLTDGRPRTRGGAATPDARTSTRIAAGRAQQQRPRQDENEEDDQ